MQQNDSLADGQVKHDVFGYIVPSWVDDVEEHGYICLKSSAGDELVRRGGFQHNRKLRAGGSWDPKAVEEVCECAKKGVPLAAAA